MLVPGIRRSSCQARAPFCPGLVLRRHAGLLHRTIARRWPRAAREATILLTRPHAQTREHPAVRSLPVDAMRAPERNPVEYFLHCITTGTPLTGPLSPAISRIGQQIVDSAVLSAREKRTVALLG